MAQITNLIFRTRILVNEQERVLILRDGKFNDILSPGRHVLSKLSGGIIEVEEHNLNRPEFVSKYDNVLFKDYSELAEKHLLEVRTSSEEVAIIYRDSKIFGVLKPDGRSVYWKDSGPFKVEKIDVSETLEVKPKLAVRIANLGNVTQVKRFNVDEGQVGLLYVDNVLEKSLKPGTYAYFNVGKSVNVKQIDVRERAIDLAGQEILTKDRVSIRVNIVATYKVIDPVKAVSEVSDFYDALYRSLQHAFRLSLGAKTLDEILGNKVSVDTGVAEKVRERMAEIGVEVGEISMKDIILPGDMREILNKVVQAQKEAEANVIRRREETSATRSLLNTAKVMEENPVMLRLKELEALEKISEKVGYLTVHNGTQGLLEDLVSLRTKDSA